MTSLSDHHASSIQKLLYIGDSGTGKTGSLVSLVEAGYKLRILDLDNGLDALRNYALLAKCDLDMVDFETVCDTYIATPMGLVIKGAPKAFVGSTKLLTKWSDDTYPYQWGEDTIFVLDSLKRLGRCAFEWAKGMNPSAKEPRTWFYTAQKACEDMIALLTGKDFKTNVIIISHVNMIELKDGTTKGYPDAIGVALSKVVATYFNTMILAERTGSGANVKRTIRTLPTTLIDLKNPAPFKLDDSLPLSTGLATVFEKLKET